MPPASPGGGWRSHTAGTLPTPPAISPTRGEVCVAQTHYECCVPGTLPPWSPSSLLIGTGGVGRELRTQHVARGLCSPRGPGWRAPWAAERRELPPPRLHLLTPWVSAARCQAAGITPGTVLVFPQAVKLGPSNSCPLRKGWAKCKDGTTQTQNLRVFTLNAPCLIFTCV